MSQLLELVADLSVPVRVGWALWFSWCAVQWLWYRRARQRAPVLVRALPRASLGGAVPAGRARLAPSDGDSAEPAPGRGGAGDACEPGEAESLEAIPAS